MLIYLYYANPVPCHEDMGESCLDTIGRMYGAFHVLKKINACMPPYVEMCLHTITPSGRFLYSRHILIQGLSELVIRRIMALYTPVKMVVIDCATGDSSHGGLLVQSAAFLRQ